MSPRNLFRVPFFGTIPSTGSSDVGADPDAAVTDPPVDAATPPWLQNKVLRKFAARYTDILAGCRQTITSDAPLVIGPWTSEVGFELLYWIPMLRFLHETVGWDPARAAVVTRGGASAWYDGLAGRSCEVFELMSGDEYKSGNERRWQSMHGSQKQKRMTDVDERVLERAADGLGFAAYAALHPKVMYKTLNLYWTGVLGLNWYESFTRFAPLQVPATGIRAQLPDDYYAVKFYFRPSFPDTPANRAFIAACIRSLSARKPVVVLETGVGLDDHVEYAAVGDGPRVIRVDLSDRLTANLALQSEVIAGSSGFFGTYGGLSYLPMYFDVPSVGFLSEEDEVLPLHHTAAQHACSVLRRDHGCTQARIRVLGTADAAVLSAASLT